VVIELSGWACPLTPLENALRRVSGASGYSSGFIEHYLASIVYPPGLSYSVQLVLAGLVVLINSLVYLFVWRRRQEGLAA
jgi:hypothetical protein